MYKKFYILFFAFFVCSGAVCQVKIDEPKDDFKIVFPQKTFDNQKVEPKKQEQSRVEQPTSDNKKSNAKTPTLVHLVNSDSLDYNEVLRAGAQLLYGNVTFEHDGVYLFCDSAYFYQQNNSFNAFGNVVINQGDTLFVYGDVLYYDGNTKLARLRDNVLMDNLTATLTTDSLNYDRVKNIGYYFDGGTIQDTLNTLVSETGYYYPNTKTAVFRRNVVLTNPDFTMHSDTLRYNVATKIASIVGATDIIYDKETHIYSEYGWYNTDNEQSKLLKNSYILHDSGKKLVADTIFYDKKLGKGEGFTNVALTDTIKKISLRGHYGYYIENQEIGLVTDSAVMVEYSSQDTLFLHADTLYTRAETYQVFELLEPRAKSQEPRQEANIDNDTTLLNDTISLTPNDTASLTPNTYSLTPNDTASLTPNSYLLTPNDTIWRDSTYKIFQGYPNVRFWRENVQGVCDSSYYNTRDSVLHLLKKPIIWSDERQLSGDTIRLYSKNGDVDKAVITNAAFVCEYVEDKHFNQLSGKEIVGHIFDGKLKKVDVKGNAESIYYPQDDEDKSVLLQAKTISSIMNIYFKDDKAIDRINVSPKPTGSALPLSSLTDNMLFLGNYSWQIAKKPTSKHDIFRNTNAASASNDTTLENGDAKPKKKTTRRDDIKPAESETPAQQKSQTRSTDSNRPSGFGTPNVGSSSSSLGGVGKGGLRRQQ